MGNTVSSTTTLTQVLNDVNSNMTSIMQKQVSANSTTCSSNANVSLTFGSIIGCGVNIAQTTSLNCNLVSTFSNNSSTSLSTLMQQAAQQSAVAQATAVADVLSTSNVNTNTNENMSTYLSNLIQTNITSDTESYCQAQGTVNENLTLNVGTIDCTSNPNAGLNLSQNAQLQVVANCMTTQLQNIINSAQTYQSSSQTGSASSSGSASGASSFITAVGNAISSIIGSVGSLLSSPAILALVIVFILIGVVVLFYKLFGGGGSSGTTAPSIVYAQPPQQPQSPSPSPSASPFPPSPQPVSYQPQPVYQQPPPTSYAPQYYYAQPSVLQSVANGVRTVAQSVTPENIQAVSNLAQSYQPVIQRLVTPATAIAEA
jgi:hypothetical protein